MIFVRDWEERGLPDIAVGVTTVWHDPLTGEIFDVDVQINETFGTLTVCGESGASLGGTSVPKCPSRSVDIQNVVTHEAGHYLGLGHSSNLDEHPTMAAKAVRGETEKRTLANDDRLDVCAIYGDYAPVSCEPSDFGPNNGFQSACFFPEAKGLGCGTCVAPGATRLAQPLAGGAFAFLALVAGYRWRRYVTASTSRPRPRNR